jgi:hypothetical protein
MTHRASRPGTIRMAVVFTLAGLAWAGGLFAGESGGKEHAATGEVLSTGDMSLAVKTAGGGGAAEFIVDTATKLPARVAAGERVTVYYHRLGQRKVADRVVLGAVPAQPAPETRVATNARTVHPAPASGATGGHGFRLP